MRAMEGGRKGQSMKRAISQEGNFHGGLEAEGALAFRAGTYRLLGAPDDAGGQH